MKEKIAFIGFGKFGQSLASVLRQKDRYRIAAFDVADSGDECQMPSAQEALDGASYVFLVVPSSVFRSCVRELPLPQVPLISCTKGIDSESQKTPVEILHELFPGHETAVLSGPMLSEELLEGLPAAGTIASANITTAKKVKKLFKGTSVFLETSKDEIGVTWCGVLKNVYALVLGLCDGLKLGDNFKSLLTRQALQEEGEIMKLVGGEKKSILTFAGVGDLLATGYCAKSRNYSYGYALGCGDPLPDVLAEGVKNIENVATIAQGKKKLPLFDVTREIFVKDAPPRETLLAFHNKL